jgi:hypothetical protein
VRLTNENIPPWSYLLGLGLNLGPMF